MTNYFIRSVTGQKLYLFLFVFHLAFISNINAQENRKVSFQRSELELKTASVEDNGEEFQKLNMKDLYNTGVGPGMPELPVKYVKLIVPAGMDISEVRFTASGKENIQLQKRVYPVQYPIPTAINYTHKAAKPDSLTYNSNSPYPPELVKVVEDGYFDGNHIVTLAVYPLQYLPKSGIVIFHSDIDFSLAFTAGKGMERNVARRSKKDQDIYDAMLHGLVDNPEDIMKYQIKPRVIESYEPINNSAEKNLAVQSVNGNLRYFKYVIITTTDLMSGFNDFIKWKKRKGLDIGIVTIDQILANYSGDLISGLNDDAGKLRQYLSDGFYNHGTLYALLAGDRNVIPFRYGTGIINGWNDINTRKEENHIPSDLYFSDFDGNWNYDGDFSIGEGPSDQTGTGDLVDYLPEISVGRILCQNVDEVTSWAKKVIEYEQNPFQGTYEYLKKCLWTQSDEMQENGEAQSVASSIPFAHTYIEELPINDPDHPTSPTGPDVINKINEGFGFYNIYNHGEYHDYVVRWPGAHVLDGDKTNFCSAIYGK